MTVDPNETYDRVESACSFPADRSEVVAAVGSVTIESPDGETVSLEAVLERGGESSFESARELHHTVLANLGEEYVGREDYDDRSSNHERDSQVSF